MLNPQKSCELRSAQHIYCTNVLLLLVWQPRALFARNGPRRTRPGSTLEATQGQIDGFFSQLPHNCHQNRMASVGDWLKICPWVTSRVESGVNSWDQVISELSRHGLRSTRPDLCVSISLDAVYVDVVPWPEFPIVSSYPHCPHGLPSTLASTQGPSWGYVKVIF